MNTYLQAALQIQKSGLIPIPLRGKIPQIKEWDELRSVTPEQLMAWEMLFENVGVVCGEGSENLVVVDFDKLIGYDLFCERFPSLTDTFTVATGSGVGRHVYFKADKLPESTGVMNIYDAPKEAKAEWVNIEFKANGRQVVVPPSLHPETRQPYSVLKRVSIRHLPHMEEIVRWAFGLKTIETWTPPVIRVSSQDPLNPAVLDALERHFSGASHKMHNGWVNCPCPKGNAHKHGDKHFTFGYNPQSGVGNCFSCGTMLTKELCELVGVDYSSLGGLFLGTPPAKRTEYRAPDVRLAATPKATPTVAVSYVSDHEALDQYIAEVNNEAIPLVQPLIMPYPFLHAYGGCAHFLMPGQVAYFASISGGTKTIGFETGWTQLQREGVHSVVYSPEHVDANGASLMTARAVQRAGGIRVYEKLNQMIWQLAHQDRLEERGKPITSQAISESIAAASRLKRLPGRLFYLKTAGMSAEKLCAEVETVYDLEAAKGNPPRVVWVDYAQMLWLENNEQGRIWIETAINQIKDMCQRKKLVGFVSSQMKKSDAESAKQEGEFDAGMMQWLSDQQCNFLLMFAPKMRDGRRVPDKLRARILKNSLAAPPEDEFEIAVDFPHLSWMFNAKGRAS